MDQEPNYENYTLEELHDARAHLNRERYPDRVARLEALIQEYVEDLEEPQVKIARPLLIPAIVIKVVGIWEIAAPASAIIAAAISGATLPFFGASGGFWGYLVVLLFWILSTLSICAGVFLLFDHRIGYSLSKLVQGIQVLSFRLGSLTYAIFIGGWILIDVNADGGFFGLRASANALRTQLTILLGDGNWFIGINVIALALFLLVQEGQAQRSIGTINRVTQSENAG